MSKLILEITMSLDGFVAGPNQTLDEPLGAGGEELHQWAFAASAWRESHGISGGEDNADSDVIEESAGEDGRHDDGPEDVQRRRRRRGRTTRTRTAGGATSRRSATPSSSSPTTPASRCR